MAKVKMLFLTCVTTEMNEKGKEKFKKINKKIDGEEEATSGVVNKKWFIDQGLPVPPLFQDEENDEPEIDENGYMTLQEDEIEYIHDDIILERSDFASAVDCQDGLTTVYCKSGTIYSVLENTNDIYEQIYLLDQSWLENLYEEVKWKIKRIFKKEKDLIL